MGINVLGPLGVDGDPHLSPRDRVILAALATRPGQPMSADRLADALWHDKPPSSAAKNLQGCVVRLRKALGADAIKTSARGYLLAVPADEVDAQRFERMVTRARELLALGEPDRAAYLLGEALALWRGPAFADLDGWEVAEVEAGRLDELRLEAEELRVDASIRAGRHAEVLAEAEALVRAAPLRERRWALLALAQYQSGRQSEALRSIQQVKAVLLNQLGLDPGPELAELEQAILRQDEALRVPGALPGRGEVCPYQGLTPYDVDDAESFFGRDEDLDVCLEIVRRTSVLAVVGPSGTGKSSLVRAGVAAALRRQGRRVIVLSPGEHPTRALPDLPASRADDVLVVDQCEEVFSLCDDATERRDFVTALVAHAERCTVVVALRTDHLTDVARHSGLARLVERGLHLLGGMDEGGLRAAIEGPARQSGLIIEPGLVDLLVREVQDEPGALPLLSHSLVETWKRREGRTLTVAGYRDTGGISHAVAQSAERVYAHLDPDQRQLLRSLVLRLVAPGPEGEPVRSRVPRRQLAAGPDQTALIDRLVAARLVTSDEGIVEISHESLARAWPRLRAWLDDDIEGQRILHHLSGAADAWDGLGRPDSELYRGVRLARAVEWCDRSGTTLTATEGDFLAASQRLVAAEQRSAEERARVQARLIKRLRTVLAGAVALLVLALVAGGFAAVQSDRADRNAAEAWQAAVSADARRVGLRSQLTDDISLSLLLAAAGVRLDDSPETRVNLLTALEKQPTLVRSAPPKGGYLEVFDVSPDGRWIASSDDQNRMHLYDASSNRLLRSYDASRPPEAEGVMLAQFSPDSRQLAVILEGSESSEPVRLLDPSTMEPTTKLDFPGGKAVWGVDVAFSADGRHLAATVQTVNWPGRGASGALGYAVVWDLRSPSTPPIRVPTGTDVQGVELSPDGETLYTTWPLTAYKVATGERIWRREGIEASYTALDVNAEGTLLAIAPVEDVLLVDATSGDTVRTLRGHRDAVLIDTRFSPDGTLVGSTGSDYELIVWDTATGRQLGRWRTFDEWGVGFSPDNDLVYGGGASGSMLRTWDLSMEDTYLQATTHVGDADPFVHADISPDGQRVAYSWLDDRDRGWARFVDTVTGDATSPVRFPVWDGLWFNGVDGWHPDGGQYVGYWCEQQQSCATPGTVAVLDSTTGKLIRKEDIVEGEGDIYSLGYVDEGRSLLAGVTDGNTHNVGAVTLSPLGEPFDFVLSCCTTPIGDGSTAMVYEWSADGASTHWRVLDVGNGEVLSEGDVDLYVQASVATPDGSTVAVAGDTGQIVTIDVSTGAEQRSTSLGAVVLWLDYSADGELLVSGDADGGVSLWDATTLDLLGTVFPPHRGEPVPAGAQFIGDSHDVSIASYDGNVYRWDTDVERAIDFACQMAGRNLTEEEWAEFLPTQPYREVCPEL
jgi:DNA-binding SARP family transcriptional activator/WD40 repeat protein